MDFILKFNADIAQKNNKIARKKGELDVTCPLTIDEMKMTVNEPDTKQAIIEEVELKHKIKAINIEIYDVLEKMN